jgi:hypothetical protein
MRLTQSPLLLLAVLVPCTARAQRAPAAASAMLTADGYSTDSTSFVVGRRVYLRSTRTYIGRIIAADDRHDFRDGHFQRPWAKAVLIERRDGPHEWAPVERISRIYAVK